jgi:hypothetical protein
MQDLFFEFLRSPSKETFLAVRSALVASPSYDAYSRDLNVIEEAYQAERFEKVRQQASATMGNLLLSPRLHLVAGLAARKLGDAKAADAELFICHCCIEGILSTGDGSANAPYLVTRTSDEYDVLMHTNKKMQQQALTHKDERSYDVLTCSDGTEYWFDITDAFACLEKQFSKKG